MLTLVAFWLSPCFVCCTSPSNECDDPDSVQCVDSDEPLMCLERLEQSDLDCKEKSSWISTTSLNGDLIHQTAQEI